MLLPLMWAGTGALVAGCERASSPSQYQTLSGRVLARDTETRELSVSVRRRHPGEPVEQTVFCVVTDDSEVYINDMFSTLEALEVEDTIELVGRYDRDPQQERFVVSLAYVNRRLPPPALPDLPPPTTQPTTQPQHEG